MRTSSAKARQHRFHVRAHQRYSRQQRVLRHHFPRLNLAARVSSAARDTAAHRKIVRHREAISSAMGPPFTLMAGVVARPNKPIASSRYRSRGIRSCQFREMPSLPALCPAAQKRNTSAARARTYSSTVSRTVTPKGRARRRMYMP